VGLFLFWTIWENEQKYQVLDEYHWVNNTGLLSVEEVQAIAEKEEEMSMRQYSTKTAGKLRQLDPFDCPSMFLKCVIL